MSQSPALPEREDHRSTKMKGDIHEILTSWIEMYRETVLLKVAGLTPAQLCERPAPPSTLTLAGVVRHLTEVEAYWVREVLEGNDELPDYYSSRSDPDGDFNRANPATALSDIATYEREVAETRQILGRWTDLNALAQGQRKGQSVSLGWILTHLIEEYARHLGHMDILRELVDGRTGY